MTMTAKDIGTGGDTVLYTLLYERDALPLTSSQPHRLFVDVRRDGAWWTEPGDYRVSVGRFAGNAHADGQPAPNGRCRACG